MAIYLTNLTIYHIHENSKNKNNSACILLEIIRLINKTTIWFKVSLIIKFILVLVVIIIYVS